MKPTSADNRTRNLLILRAPASSSFVVPAIPFQELTESAPFSRGHKRHKQAQEIGVHPCSETDFLGTLAALAAGNATIIQPT